MTTTATPQTKPLKDWEITPEQVRALRAELGPGVEIAEVGFPEYGLGFIVKSPTQAEWTAHRSAQETEQGTADPYGTMQGFVMQHLVRPSPLEAQQHFDARPALIERINARLFELAGAKTEVTLKKL